MIGDLARWLEARLRAQVYAQEHATGRHAHELQLVAAALLVEAARADHHFSDEEKRNLASLLREHYALSPADSDELILRASEHAAKAVSLSDLTQVVNRHCDQSARKQLLVLMWRVALADGRVDKYEEYVIRQVAGLLYVAHEDFVHARHLARDTGRGELQGTPDSPESNRHPLQDS